MDAGRMADKVGIGRARGHAVCAQRLPVLVAIGLTLLSAPDAPAQIRDEVRVYAYDASNNFAASFVRFSRKLVPLGATSVTSLGGSSGFSGGTPMSLDGLGRSWIAKDPLGPKLLARIEADGLLLASAQLGDNPINVVVDADGRAFALTRIGLSSPGPAYGVDADASVLWSSMSGPSLYNFSYPQHLAVTVSGEVWIGDATVLVAGQKARPFLVQIDKGNGSVLQTLELPVPAVPTLHAGICRLAPAGDGSLWSLVCGSDPYYWLVKSSGTQVLDLFPIDGGYSGVTYRMHVDAYDRPHVLSTYDAAGGFGSKLLRYDPAKPAAPDAIFQFGATIRGWALGPSGEEAFAVVSPSFDHRLERMNFVTATKSSVPLEPLWPGNYLAANDPTGFLYANVIDRNGDNDGDGAPNGAETAAGSNPFDPQSRPEGPKVYLSFAPTTNAIVLSYLDPDGLLDPSGGLDLSTLVLLTGAGTNVFQFILPFLSAVEVSPDGKQATATFGLLPLPSNLKIRLEARVSDLTGAVGWDWQVTPPGDL